mgnify:FL=1
MKQELGKVIEVFIPQEYKNNKLIDVMDIKNIGFKVMTDNGIKEIIQEQNEFNSNIMKNDIVLITEQTISNKKFIDIELYEVSNE